MTELLFELADDTRPVYLRIAEGVRHMIDAGRIGPGDALPSSRDLARRLGVNRHTVMAALQELVAQGWLVPHERAAYRVNARLPVEPVARGRARANDADGESFPWARIGRERMPPLPPDDPRPFTIDFSHGTPDLRLFPVDEFRLALKRALRGDAQRILDYGDPAGYPPFVAALRDYLCRTRGIDGREIVVTNGSMEALMLFAKLLLGPGKCAVVEALCYPPMLALFRHTGADVVPVEVDERGLVPEALERVLADRRVDLLYLTPLHHYPTTVTMPLPRRRRIYALARRHCVPIVEDDYDHEFHYRSQPLAPMAADDPHGLVLYVSSFSKSLFPASRIGYAAVPPALYPALRALHRLNVTQNEGIVQAAFATWMAADGFERHLRRMRRTYDERMRHALRSIEALQVPGVRVDPVPDGGMTLWLDTGRAAAAVADRARAHGVRILPEPYYRVEPDCGGSHLRLGFARLEPDEIDRGLQLLARAIGEVPQTDA